MTNLHDGSDGFYRPPGVPVPLTPAQAGEDIVSTLNRINRQRDQIGAGELEALDPADLAVKVELLAETLVLSVRFGGQLTDDRAREVGAYVVAFLLSRARARELDVTSGDAA